MEKIQAHLQGELIFSNTPEAHEMNNKSFFGEKKQDRIQYTIAEAIFLIEKDKMDLLNSRGGKIPKKDIMNKMRKIDSKIQIKYLVYKDLRERGYIVKTALKFGADFRVYDKGQKPGEEHAKWIVFCEHETAKFSWHEFSSKNRVAHSTKKNLLLAIVDEETDITYFEVSWIKP